MLSKPGASKTVSMFNIILFSSNVRLHLHLIYTIQSVGLISLGSSAIISMLVAISHPHLIENSLKTAQIIIASVDMLSYILMSLYYSLQSYFPCSALTKPILLPFAMRCGDVQYTSSPFQYVQSTFAPKRDVS